MSSKQSGAHSRFASLGLIAAILLAMAGPLAVYAGAGTMVRQAAIQAVEAANAAQKTARLREVIGPGRDVDGDGDSDFVNPTGKGMRTEDNFGSGAFLSSRDGGVRRHLGADYTATGGQGVDAPISGYVTKIGYAYADDQALRYVELTNRAIGYAVRVFYIQPAVVVGQAVRLGQVIGKAESLQKRYPGITDHVHVEVADLARGHVDPNKFIPSPELSL